MKKRFLTLALALALVVAAAVPAFAATAVNLSVNDKAVPFIDLVAENGITRIAVEDFTRISGVDALWTAPDTVQFSKNGDVLALNVGKREAVLNGKKVTLPCSPVHSGGKLTVPLRFLGETFGCDLDWDPGKMQVLFECQEKKDGMTPDQLLFKSNQASQQVNTYSLEGFTKMRIDLLADGKRIPGVPMDFSSEQKGSVQDEPFEIYIKQSVIPKAAGVAAPEEVIVESYLTEDKIYTRMAGQDWIVQEMPFTPEFWKEQRDIQSDPIKAAAYLQENGVILNFGDDLLLDGKDYYVINVSLDLAEFQRNYRDLLQKMSPDISQDLPPAMLQQMEQILSKAQFDYDYKVYIDKETLFSEILDFKCTIDLNLKKADLQQLGIPVAAEKLPGEVKVSLELEGNYKLNDFGEPFIAPDVSAAKEISEIQP